MRHVPLRDAAGRIVDMVEEGKGPAGEPSLQELFAEARRDLGVPGAEGAKGVPASPPEAPQTEVEQPRAVRARRPLQLDQVGAGVAIGVLLALALLGLWGDRARSAAGDRATSAPQRPPTATPLRTTRAIVAYAAPGGAPLGALEPGRVYTTTARYEDTWARLEVQGSGALWVQVAELGATAAPSLPDLAPTATPTSAPTAPPPTAEPVEVARPSSPPLAAPPETCTEATAPYRRAGTGALDGAPVGDYRVWSCVSEAEVAGLALQAEEQIRANVRLTQTAQAQRPTATSAPRPAAPTTTAR